MLRLAGRTLRIFQSILEHATKWLNALLFQDEPWLLLLYDALPIRLIRHTYLHGRVAPLGRKRSLPCTAGSPPPGRCSHCTGGWDLRVVPACAERDCLRWAGSCPEHPDTTDMVGIPWLHHTRPQTWRSGEDHGPTPLGVHRADRHGQLPGTSTNWSTGLCAGTRGSRRAPGLLHKHRLGWWPRAPCGGSRLPQVGQVREAHFEELSLVRP